MLIIYKQKGEGEGGSYQLLDKFRRAESKKYTILLEKMHFNHKLKIDN